MSAAAHQIAEPAVHHAFLDAEVEHGLFFAVVDTGELSLLRLLVDHANALDDVGRKVLAGDRRIVEEELLAVDLYLIDGLAVGRNGAVRRHFHARKLLEQVFQYVVVARLDKSDVVGNCVLLYDDGVADIRHHCTFDEVALHSHFLGAEIDVAVDVDHLFIVVVAEQDGRDLVFAGRNALDLGSAVRAGLGEFQHCVLSVGSDGNRGKADWFTVAFVDELDLEIVILSLRL